jgi:FkbM family methyltransferase
MMQSEARLAVAELRLNHYATQSLEYFTNVKMTRGDVYRESHDNFRDMNYFNEYNTRNNTLYDTTLYLKHAWLYDSIDEGKNTDEILAEMCDHVANSFSIVDENNVPIHTEYVEKCEQDFAEKYISPDDVVLELGARYGSVSCKINFNLNNKTNQVVVEPDDRVWKALKRNRGANKCRFHIVEGFISKKPMDLENLGSNYGTTSFYNTETTIPRFTLNEIKETYGLCFDVLVADCEGFLGQFLEENPECYDEMKMMIFECDYREKCNYDDIADTLKQKGFELIDKGFGGAHQVWKKQTQEI